MKLTLENKHIRLKQCRYGPMLYLYKDQYIGQSLDRYGEYSEGEAFFFRTLTHPVPQSEWLALDIGANHGAHTIALAKCSKVVLAFEPQRILFQILNANVVLNSAMNVFTFQQAVGSAAGTILVPPLDYTKSENFGALVLGGDVGERVQVVTIDSLNLPECHFIKLDVEGMEHEALLGARQTLTRLKPTVYFESDRNATACFTYLLKLGYRLYWHLPFYFNHFNYFGETENVFGLTISVNTLAVPSEQVQPEGLREITTPDANWRV